MTASSRSSVRGIRRIDLAYVKLASSEDARDINRDIVLELIRCKQPIARADLARLSGLQPSTVSAIVEQLIAEKWVTEGAVVRRPRGRRPTLLSLNDRLVILAADIRPNQGIVALVDLNGRFLERETVSLVRQPERSGQKIITCMQLILSRHADRSCEGVGISMPGRVDPETQRLILAPNLKWTNYDLKTAVQDAMGLRVELANAANACLLSELWSGRLDGVRDAVLVTVSEGIGTAILANGQLITGTNGLAGEFGHSPIDPSGPLCGCGQRGCWEMFASSRAGQRYYAEISKNDGVIPIPQLLQLAEEGDKRAIEAVMRQVTWLGRGLRLVTASLAPRKILITGDIATVWPRFGPIVQREMEKTMLAGTPPQLEITTDPELARLRGAAAVVLQRHSGSNRPA
ncbi:ROK family protein [Acidicapsa dinghuensis]|uniref:ROK family protein n=1 Tax=Acidicapsa dinghuensis TaxID=2218256 RepID=A0ABW1EEV2_9BACT|nr:ROK family protein [Acidicapsa dinghuensis]